MTSIDILVSQENAATNGRGNNGVNIEYNAAGSAAACSTLGTISPPAGQTAVSGFQSATFSAGYDLVLLDGPRTSYAIQVNSTGVTTITDIGAGDATKGQTVTITGESTVIFNGAHIGLSDSSTPSAMTTPPGSSTAVLNYPNDVYHVLNTANAQLAQFYSALLPWEPQPALSGLEYWETRLAQGMSINAIAQSFINTGYFQQTFGDPGTTHAQHLGYVELLYSNILGMNLDASNSGVQYWTGQMDNGTLDGAATLISFTNATATTSLINAAAGLSAGTGTGWLINYSLTGGYADPGVQLPAATVLTAGNQTAYVDTSQIDTSNIANTTTIIGNYRLDGAGVNGGVYNSISVNGPNDTAVASSNVRVLAAGAPNDTLITAPSGGTYITTSGTNTTVILYGSNNQVSTNALGTTVVGYKLGGADSLIFGTGDGGANPAVVTSASPTNKFDGHQISTVIGQPAGPYIANTGVFIYVGTVADNSAASMAIAANTIYTVADIAGAFGEHVVFYGQCGSDTIMYNWQNPATGSGSLYRLAADANNNHLVDAGELTSSIQLLGINALSITAADLKTH